MTHPFRFGIQANAPADPNGWAALARQAEELGYSTFSMADHFSNQLSATPALAMAAAATTALRIGAMVFCNDFRHPVVLAHDAGTLDVLSGGRLELGIGAGWMHTDYEQTGMTYDSPGTRIKRMEEATGIIKSWFTAEEFSFAGEWYTIDGLTGHPPTQKPHPPILMGGGAPRMLKTAARCADIIGLNASLSAGVIDASAGPSATLARTREKISWIREEAGDRFESIELQSRVHLATVTDDAAGFAEVMGPAVGLTAEEAMASPHALAGTVDEIVDKIGRLRDDVGVSYLTWGATEMEAMAPVVAQLAGH